jgi:transcriptional regulator GlxA family with amidase domain
VFRSFIVQVLLFIHPGLHMLELTGIRDALFEANQRLPPERQYDTRIVAAEPGVMRSGSGLCVLTDHGIADAPGPADTLIVVGTHEIPEPAPEPVLTWLRQQAAAARRHGSVCTGAFLLGAAGLLDGRHATTHWQYAEALASRYPAARIEPDRIFVRDGSLITSAGSSAAIDLTLALIEEDHGRALALWVARRLVVFLKRPGGQSQFSVQLAAQVAQRTPIERAQQAVRDNPAGGFDLVELAQIAAMSPRNFSRVFRQETGISPADFVEMTRMEVARGLLEDSGMSIQEVARRSGFGNAGAARRVFLRRLGLTPSEYRERFRSAGPV